MDRGEGVGDTGPGGEGAGTPGDRATPPTGHQIFTISVDIDQIDPVIPLADIWHTIQMNRGTFVRGGG